MHRASAPRDQQAFNVGGTDVSQDMAGGWTLVSALSVAQLVTWGVVYYSFSQFLIPMERELGWTRDQCLGAVSLALGIQGLCTFWVGAWIDRYGGRWLMTAGSAAGVLLLVAWSQSQTLIGYYLSWMGLGAVMATTLYDPVMAVLVRGFPTTFRRRMTVLTLVSGFASTVFIPLTQALIEGVGWRCALIVLALIKAVTTIPAYGLWLRDAPKPRAPAPCPSARLAGQILPGDHSAADTRSGVTPRGQIIHRALRNPVFWCLALSFSAFSLASNALIVNIFPLLSASGYAPTDIVAALALLGPVMVGARVLLLSLERSLAAGSFGFVAVSALPVAMAVMGFYQGQWWALFAFAIAFGVGNGLITILRGVAIPDLIGTQHFGAVSGAMILPSYFFRAAAPLGAALVWQRSGGARGVIWAIFASAVISAIAFALAVAFASRRGSQIQNAR